MTVELAPQIQRETKAPPPPISIRSYVSPVGNELDAVAAALRIIHQGVNSSTAPHYVTTAESVIKALTEDSIILIATTSDHENTPIGYALLTAPPPHSGGTREVAVLVGEAYRHNGFATRMFLELLSQARKRNIVNCSAVFKSSNNGVWHLLRAAQDKKLIQYTCEIRGYETTVQIELLYTNQNQSTDTDDCGDDFFSPVGRFFEED